MEEVGKLSWTAYEYEEKFRSRDWFWALGVIVITGALAALIFGNYFFATLILLGGGLLGHYATKRPKIISYELNERGLQIDSQLYPYENLKSFWVEPGDKPTLFVRSGRAFMPVLSIPIDNDLALQIQVVMTEMEVLEEEMREHPTE